MVCVYDSGVGGVSTLMALRRLVPTVDVCYLGDTARVPYGPRDAATVCRYATEALDYLAALRPEAILVACGTGALALVSVLPEGKGKMNAADFIRGRKIAGGDLLK